MAATPTNSLINLSIPATAPDGFTEPQVKAAVELFLNGFNNFLREFERYTGATQKDVTLWPNLLPSDTLIRNQAGRLYAIASEAISVGDFVNLHNVAGVLNVRKANGAAGLVKPANGYCSTTGGVALGASGEFILSQGILTITGILPGQNIYLSTTPGLASVTPLTGAGQLEQYIGVGVANNLASIDISCGQYVQH